MRAAVSRLIRVGEHAQIIRSWTPYAIVIRPF
jgi:hypothetical protein